MGTVKMFTALEENRPRRRIPLDTLFDPETTMKLEPYRGLALACLLFSTAHGDSTNQHIVTLGMQADANDNRQWLGKFALPLGDRAWAQGSLGRTELATNAGARKTKIVGAAFGFGGDAVSTAVDFVQRKGGDQFEQQQWTAALDWHGLRGGFGADVLLRSASNVSTTTQSRGPFTPPVTTTIRESADCRGFGLHGDFDLTPQAKVFAGAMRYRCDFELGSTTTGSSSPLASLLGADAGLSGAWREQALTDRSYRLGTSYQFRSAALVTQYFRDRIANADEVMNTIQAQVDFPVAEHWRLSPMVGYSSGGNVGDVGFGGVNVSFNW
jgi:hypothetical protein